MRKLVCGSMIASVALLAASCGKSPDAPSSSFTAPLASGPSNAASYRFRDQPVTLAIVNAVRTGSDTPTYSVEVATDSGFSNKVFTRDGIAEGSGSGTSLTLSNLAGGQTYYWHWKAVLDGVTGPPSPTQQFTVGPQVVIDVPALVGPANGAVTGTRPTLTVRNATRTGPAGPITYEFQIATAAGFGSILASGTAPEQSVSTSWTVVNELPEGDLFWRVRAVDAANGESSSFTAATAFTARRFNLHNAVILNNPSDLADWAETAQITRIDTSGQMIVDFDKRTGPGRWPESPFGTGAIQYTLGMCLNISGQWYCSAVVHFWDDRELEAGGAASEIAINWFYDARWGPMAGHQPAPGELVGLFVAQGNLRDNGNTTVKERSNVVLLPFGSSYRR
jgi:hypothetical protein